MRTIPKIIAQRVRTAMALCLLCLIGISFMKTAESATTDWPSSAAENDPLDAYYSEKTLGVTFDGHNTCFRLFAPRATRVVLRLFLHPEDDAGVDHELVRDDDGVWELMLPESLWGRYYAYSIDGPKAADEEFDPEKWVADPYSFAVATQNEYLHRGKSLIVDISDYDWQGDAPVGHAPEDLIIYECHLRDMTAHPSAGIDAHRAGSYLAFIEGGRGGINHIRSLGVNAVEFLPIHDFGNIEIPYGVPVGDVINTWNPYARNHWGYMTSYFFAPESYYASGERLMGAKYCGAEGRQVKEFRDVVRTLHREGIAVILDVVYNHVSQYDQNCFKQIDKKYYFRLNPDGSYASVSGCGNDLRTERPMVRRLILDSIKFWMQEYHVDGFRFDLAAMIDWQTCDEILREARKINPNVILIAEPWGGGYAPAEFSRRGWAAWNDQFRNGVKGQNPFNNRSYIFGRWFGDNSLETLKRYVLGTPVEHGGLFVDKRHAVNYLESHDDHTLGDFIRIGLGGAEKVQDPSRNAVLTADQLSLNKLAALILMTSQGVAMMHAGQEWARSKVIAATEAPDDHVGHIDRNSYNKDNETNWLNYDHAELNRELVDYYRGLIALRKKHPAFRSSGNEDFEFMTIKRNPFALGYRIYRNSSGDTHDFLVLLNAHRSKIAQFKMPAGKWTVVVDRRAGVDMPLRAKKIKIMPSSGMVLRKED